MKILETSIQIQGIKIRLTTNYQAYYDYFRLHFNKALMAFGPDKPKIEISAEWKMDLWGKHSPRLEKNDLLHAIGANTLIGEGRISAIRKVGKKRKLWLDYTLEKDRLILKAASHRKIIKDNMRYALLRQPQEPIFFELTYPLVYYPLFWYLETLKNTHILHASAVKMKNKCVFICGLDGIGKTTLALSLSKEPGCALFSDNLIFYDKDYVSPCYEPIRIHKADEKSLWEGRFRRINAFRTLKDFYEPLSFDPRLKERPDIAIIPFFGSGFSTRKIENAEFAQKALNINQLTAELGNYNEYACLLNLLVPQYDIWQERAKALQSLLGQARCFEITMRKEDGVERNMQRVREFILQN